MKYLSFQLNMPGAPTWNGKWSGEGKLYAKIVKFGKKEEQKAADLAKQGYFNYSWSDGWRASIDVKEVDAKSAARIKKKSQGFCGYDWMISSIINRGVIKANHEI